MIEPGYRIALRGSTTLRRKNAASRYVRPSTSMAMAKVRRSLVVSERGTCADLSAEARLGYVPGEPQGWRHLHGLDVPCGITIPWFAEGYLWAVKVRRAYGEPKYVQIAGGSTDGLYNTDALAEHHTALLCEGEFDALVLQQEVGDLLAPVTLGSATARLSGHWHDKLVGQRTIFVSYDQDTAGERGMNRLLKLSPRFQPLLLPDGKDVTDFYLSGGDVYGWVAGPLLPGKTARSGCSE